MMSKEQLIALIYVTEKELKRTDLKKMLEYNGVFDKEIDEFIDKLKLLFLQ